MEEFIESSIDVLTKSYKSGKKETSNNSQEDAQKDIDQW